VAVVGPGETLAQVAVRTLGEARAVAELRAFNGLPEGAELAPGSQVRVPGPERARAQRALGAAQAAVRAVDAVDAGSHPEALARLAEAEHHFRSARYEAAARAADAAWAGVSGRGGPVRFRVAVDPDGGTTEVESLAGAPVRVEAQGRTQLVAPGEQTRVARGQPPATPSPVLPADASLRPSGPLPAPRLRAPAQAALLSLRPASGGATLSPLTVRWEAVPGAEGYTVEVTSAAAPGRTWTVQARGGQATLPALPPGSYRWRVWAVQAEGRGRPSPARPFTLQEERLELDVKGSSWQ
jgi:hypothetical protein